MAIARRGVLSMGLLSCVAGWLLPDKAKARSFADVGAFRAVVMTAVRKQLGADRVVADPGDPAKFETFKGQWSVTSDVTNLFGHLQAYPDEDADQAIRRFVNAIEEARTRFVDESNIVPVIRSRDYVEAAINGGFDLLHEQLIADLMIVYMADRPDSMSPIKASEMPGRDLDAVRTMALHNLRRWLPKVVSEPGTIGLALYFIEENPMLSTSMILLDEFWMRISDRFPGDVFIALPRKDQLFIFMDDGSAKTRAEVQELLEITLEEGLNLLSPNLYARRSGRIVPVLD